MIKEDQTQSLTLHYWHNIFKCIGGDCPLTCCNAARWGITIDDETLGIYKGLDGDYAQTLRESIDFDGKRFKSKRELVGADGELGQHCAMLTDDGWCNIVLKYGEEYLCPTCMYYPRNILMINNHVERYVDISCPPVAGYLLDDSIPMHKIDYDKIPYIEETFIIDDNIFSCMLNTRDFLMDLFSSVDGFNAGKCFIMLSLANEMQQIFDREDIDEHSFDGIYNKYNSTDTIASILEECERFYDDTDTRVRMLQLTINMIIPAFMVLPQYANGHLDSLEAHMNEWSKGINLREDFTEFYEYLSQSFPKFVDRYMTYRAYSNWVKKDYKNFSKTVKLGYMVCLLCEICAMSVWKAKEKNLNADEFAYIISSIERDFFHDSKRITNVSASLEELETYHDFNVFLMPVY